MMKKTLALLLSAILILTAFTSCDKKTQDTNAKDAMLGVIETTGYKSKSYIHFFDDNLNFLFTKKFDYGSLSTAFDRAYCKNGEVYAIPRGEFDKGEETYILKYNINTDKSTLYNTHINCMNCLAVSNDYVFGANSTIPSTLISTIVRCSIDSPEEIFSKSFKNVIVQEMFVLEEKLYVILQDENFNILFAELSINTLEIIEQYDITQYGDPADLMYYNGKIYFSNQYTEVVYGTLSDSLTVFDLSRKTFEKIKLNEYSPNNMLVKNGLLFVSHFDRVQGEGNKISVIDLKTNEIKTHTLEHHIMRFLSLGEYFYFLDDVNLYKYAYEDSHFKLIKKVNIPTDNSSTYFYVSTFFVNEIIN